MPRWKTPQSYEISCPLSKIFEGMNFCATHQMKRGAFCLHTSAAFDGFEVSTFLAAATEACC